jgi:hypothetical protein
MGYVEDLRGKKQGQGRPRWRARYRDPSGRERSKSFTRKVDAERFLVSIEDAKLRGGLCGPGRRRLPFAEWAERWFNTTAALRPTTRRDYRKLLDQQILPAFERASLAGIDTLAVREWLAGLIAGGLGPKRAGKAPAGRDVFSGRRSGRGLRRGDRSAMGDADPLRRLLRAAAE